MKNIGTIIILAAVLLTARPAHAQPVCESLDSNRLAAVLTGNAAGHAAFTIDRERGTLSYRVDASRLANVDGAYLGRGPARVVELPGAGGILSGTASVDRNLLGELLANPSAFSVNVTTADGGGSRGSLNGRGSVLMAGSLSMASGAAGKPRADVASNAAGIFSLGFVDEDPSGDDVRVDFDVMTDSIDGFDTASVVLVDGDTTEDILDLVSDSGFTGGRLHGSVRLSRAELDRIIANPSGYHLQFRSPDDGMFSGEMGEAVTTYIPAFGRTRNGYGNHFSSDLRLHNPGSRPANVFVQFFPSGATEPLAGRTAMIRLEPNQSRVIADAVQALFGADAGMGSLRIVTSAQVIADSEILDNVQASGGVQSSSHSVRLGQFISGQGNCSAVTRGLLTSLAASRSENGFRTNVLLGNPGVRPAVAHFELRDEQGRLLDSTTLRLPAHAQMLMPLTGGNGLFHNASGELRNASLTMHADTPLFLGNSLVQNGTGEARFSSARSLAE